MKENKLERLEHEFYDTIDDNISGTNDGIDIDVHKTSGDCTKITVKHMKNFAEQISEGMYKWIGSYENPYWSYNNGIKICDTTEELIEKYFKGITNE